MSGVHQPADQRLRGARRQGAHRRSRRSTSAIEADPAFAGVHPPTPAVVVEVDRRRPGRAGGARPTGSSIRSSRPSRQGSGPRPADRPEDRRRARRADRREQRRRATGTRFRVTLPVSSASELVQIERGTDVMGRILIADDHDALRRGLARGLTEAGHEVEEASNGNAAIERLHDSYFDVVLSDLKMGGSDGMDVLRTTRAHASDDRGHPDDRVRLGQHRRRGDEDRRLRLRAEAVRDRGDGGQDREGARGEAPEERARLPPRHAAGHLRLRPHRRLERRAAEGARHRQEGGEEQHDGADPRRNRHRQGADRRRDPPQLAARRRATSSR